MGQLICSRDVIVMKRIALYLTLLSILYCSGCTIVSIRDIKKVEFTQGAEFDLKNSSTTVSVIEKWYYGDKNIIQSKPGQEITRDMILIDQYFKKKGISQVYVKISPSEDKAGYCPSCLFIWPEFTTANIQVEWQIIEKTRSGYLYKTINSRKVEYKTYTQFLLFPYGIVKLIWNVVTGEWDSEINELKYGSNLIYFSEREKAAAKLNKVMVKEIIDNNFEIPESEPKLSN